MRITKCDICKKTLKDSLKTLNVYSFDYPGSFSFCPNCAKPFITILNKHKLIKEKAK